MIQPWKTVFCLVGGILKMSNGITTRINFDDEADFTLSDVDKVEVTATVGQLKIADSAETGSEDFADDTGSTYDPNLVEFSGGVVRQKSQIPDNAVQGGTFPIGKFDLDWSEAGSVSANLAGVPTNTAGEIICAGVQGVGWAHTSGAQETFKFKYRPNYTASPPVNVNLFSQYNGVNNQDRFHLTHSPSGNTLRIQLWDSAGVNVVAVGIVIGPWEPTANELYEIMATLDSTNGVVRVFVNGTLLGTNSPGAWARGGVATYAVLGASPILYNRAEGSFDDYISFSNIQETASYPPGYSVPIARYLASVVGIPDIQYEGLETIQSLGTVELTGANVPPYSIGNTPTEIQFSLNFEDGDDQQSADNLLVNYTGRRYAMDHPFLISNLPLSMTAWCGMTADETKAGSDEIRYQSRDENGQAYYLVGDALTPTTVGNYAEANTLAEIQAVLVAAPIDVDPDGRYNTVVILHSEDGLTTPSIAWMEFEYVFFFKPELSTVCRVYGQVVDNSGDPVEGARVFFDSLNDYLNGNRFVAPFVETFSEADGTWEISLIETESTGVRVNATIEYTENDRVKSRLYGNLTIPALVSKKFSDVVADSSGGNSATTRVFGSALDITATIPVDATVEFRADIIKTQKVADKIILPSQELVPVVAGDFELDILSGIEYEFFIIINGLAESIGVGTVPFQAEVNITDIPLLN